MVRIQTGVEEEEGSAQPLKDLPSLQIGTPSQAISDMEALLIKAMGVWNTNDMRFPKAEAWKQERPTSVTTGSKRLAPVRNRREGLYKREVCFGEIGHRLLTVMGLRTG